MALKTSYQASPSRKKLVKCSTKQKNVDVISPLDPIPNNLNDLIDCSLLLQNFNSSADNDLPTMVSLDGKPEILLDKISNSVQNDETIVPFDVSSNSINENDDFTDFTVLSSDDNPVDVDECSKDPSNEKNNESTLRKQRSRLATNITNILQEADISDDEKISVLTLSIKQLDLRDKIKSMFTKPSKAGRKMIDFDVRNSVWLFYHNHSTPSTITSRPAKLKLNDKPKIQTGLSFTDSTNIATNKRGNKFYESLWMIQDDTIKNLYTKFLKESGYQISYGSFVALKPFYVRGATTQDLEMCCCKDHLHARWAIKALIQLCHNQGILISFDTYLTFFAYLSSDCKKEATSYISWECTPSKKENCDHINSKWVSLTKHLNENADENQTIRFQHFENQFHTSKKGIITNKLKAITTSANMSFIIQFILNILSKIIHHRNQLRHFRSSINIFKNFYNHIEIDIDFSENLSIPIKFEPQSMHWSQAQVTVHSGILKVDGEKYYCPEVSDDLKHDQKFGKLAIDGILKLVTIKEDSVVMIESDNCSSQYKSAEHFYDQQMLADELKKSCCEDFWDCWAREKGG